MSSSPIKLGLGSFVAVIALACGRGETKGPYVAETTGARIVHNKAAVERISSARCDREVSCNNVGVNRRFAAREDCMREYTHDKQADVGAEECPNGISGPDLEDCLADIRRERCDSPLDSIARGAACRTAKLCVR